MGRVFQSYYTKPGVLDESGKPTRFPSKHWTYEYIDAAGERRRKKAGTKENAEDALILAEAAVLNERNGLPTRRAGDISCSKLLKEYLKSITPHVTSQHLKNLEPQLKEVLRLARVYTVKMLTPEAVRKALHALAKNNLAPRTLNAYLGSVKAWMNWAVSEQILPFNPIDCLKRYDQSVKHRVRRALSDDELGRLLASAQEGPYRRALASKNKGTGRSITIKLGRQAELADAGRHIALTYRVLYETGLRKSEAKALAWSDLDLEAGTLTTRPEWQGNKSGKRDTLPLSPGLLETLKAWKQAHIANPTDKVLCVNSRTLKIFNDDLVAAGLATRDEKGKVHKADASGRTLDIHALRHTTGTRLVASGADIKTTQSLMRHATPSMTLGIYVHHDKKRMRDAVAALPEITPAKPKEQTQRIAKTGTHDTPETVLGRPRKGQGVDSDTHKSCMSKELTNKESYCWQSEGHRFDPGILHLNSAVQSSANQSKPEHAEGFTSVNGEITPSTPNCIIVQPSADKCDSDGQGKDKENEAVSVFPPVPAPIPPDLQALIEAYNDLPETLKPNALAVLKAMKPGK